MKNHDCSENDIFLATNTYLSTQHINNYRSEGDNIVFQKGHCVNAGRHHTEETKEKIRKAKKRTPSWNKGKHLIHKGSFRKGHGFSEVVLKKMSSAKLGKSLSDQHKRKISESIKNSQLAQKQRKDLHAKMAGHKWSEDFCKKISKRMMGNIPSPKCNRGKRDLYESPYQGKILLRSSYELAYAKYLDSICEPWFYEIWVFDLGNTSYIPDFYLPRKNTFIEIKGYMHKEAQKKINQFLEEYPHEQLKVLYKTDLIKLGCAVRGPK